MEVTINRRLLVIGAPLALAGCVTAQQSDLAISEPRIRPQYTAMYAAVGNEPFPVPAVDLKRVNPNFFRREVAYSTREQPGTIVVDPNERYAYLVMEGGRAMRYGVGVGKEEAFNFQGEATIARKAQWPRWTPTPNMIRRDPDRYAKYAGGLPGGEGNPLGPRALYLFRDGQDTLYRLHGTVEPWTIGTMVSSGCVRLLNQDIIDLYSRVPVGARAIVLPAGQSATT